MLPHLTTKTIGRFAAFCLVIALISAPTFGQATSQQQQSKPGSQQAPNQTQQVPAAGGPQGDVGPIAVPKKKDEPPPEPPKPAKKEQLPQFSLTVDTALVQVPVMVLTKNGQFVPGLKKDNFKVMEDGVPQTITKFTQQEAPITAVLLVEFAANNYYFMSDALNASYAFASSLKKDDWVAVISYDMKPHILADFTQDKQAVMGALNQLRIPGFSETNIFDSLYDTLDRLEGIEGRKYVILIGTGLDTFSKLNYDQMLKKIRNTKDITIFAVGTGRAFREWLDARGSRNPWFHADMLSYTQAENELQTFAKMTGGRAYIPRFEGELPQIFNDISASIRNQYVLAYKPSNAKQDGTYRKLKVELTGGPNGGPPVFKDEKGKELKVQIVAREGYTAKHEVE